MAFPLPLYEYIWMWGILWLIGSASCEQLYIQLDHAIGGTKLVQPNIHSQRPCATACDRSPFCYGFHFYERPESRCELISNLTGKHQTLASAQTTYIKTILNGRRHVYVPGPRTVNEAKATCSAMNGNLAHPFASMEYFNYLRSLDLPVFLGGKNPAEAPNSVLDPDGNDVTQFMVWGSSEPNSVSVECLILVPGYGVDDINCNTALKGYDTVCVFPHN